jgi:hypothetical protein
MATRALKSGLCFLRFCFNFLLLHILFILGAELYLNNLSSFWGPPHLTTTQRRLYPSEVLLPERKAGQPLNSIVMAHQIRTISKQRLGRLFGHLDDLVIRMEINSAIKEHPDLD